MGYTVCDTEYHGKNHAYFNMFSFEPDHFQKYAIEGLYNNKHVLVTAHTGSGKTLPAEFAIKHFISLGKKVIYTSPIKSLSNQKYHELSMQFPDISFGILTGDIKFNPEAECIIMTTEILRNIIFYADKEYSPFDFCIHLDDIKCVIFDEVHYINDQDRGHVWEECIMNLPQHIQMLMLSATINNPERFISWISDIKEKNVIITGTNKRVVPLVHYSCVNIPDSIAKKVESDIHYIHQINNQLVPIKSHHSSYIEKPIHKILKLDKFLHKMNIQLKPNFVLNSIIKKLRQEKKLPAICFVFSRKRAQEFANMIQFNLHDTEHVEDDTKKTSNVRYVCESILRQLNNHNDYSNTPEYNETLTLLEKGIAVHHSGILPILREMIELLFSKGYIKLLFATETFAVGINMPTKTVLFTSLTKYDGTQQRLLHPHEYTQMAGRAGRRGLDTIGYVIHLHSLFPPLLHSEYNHLLSGNPPTITSKLNMNLKMVLRMCESGYDFENMHIDSVLPYLQDSLVYRDIKLQLNQLQTDIQSIHHDLSQMKQNTDLFRINGIYEQVSHYIETKTNRSLYKKSKQKQIDSELRNIEANLSKYANIDKLVNTCHIFQEKTQQLRNKANEIESTKKYIQQECIEYYSILKHFHYIDDSKITKKGLFGSCILEANPMIISELYDGRYFHMLNSIEIAQVLSCFTDIRISEHNKIYKYSGNKLIESTLACIESMMEKYYDMECKQLRYVNQEDYYYHYDFIDYIQYWCEADNEEKTRYILQDIKQYNIFSGEYVKALLKIQAIALEIENACIRLQDNELVVKLHEIPKLLSKYIVTSQSLYI